MGSTLNISSIFIAGTIALAGCQFRDLTPAEGQKVAEKQNANGITNARVQGLTAAIQGQISKVTFCKGADHPGYQQIFVKQDDGSYKRFGSYYITGASSDDLTINDDYTQIPNPFYTSEEKPELVDTIVCK